MNQVILRKRDIERITGLTERTIRNMEEDGRFPRRFLINANGRSVGWQASEVEAWVQERAATRQPIVQ